MSSPPLEFILPPGWSRTRIRRAMLGRFEVRRQCEQHTVVFYDTFDWLLHRAGRSLEFASAPGAPPCARLRSMRDGVTEEQALDGLPPMQAGDWPRGPVKAVVAPISGLRALLPVVGLSGKGWVMALVDADGKTVCRVEAGEWRVDGARGGKAPAIRRLRLMPLRGWGEQAASASAALVEAGLPPASESMLECALGALGRKPRDYTQKINIDLDPRQAAGDAARIILSRLFDDMCRNEDGTRRDLDPEFLHDYRVAVRRTRSALAAFRSLFDRDRLRPFDEAFRALGRLTGEKRNLDVHLIDFDAHLDMLDDAGRDSMAGLRAILEQRREAAGREMARHLESREYRAFKREWRAFLSAPPAGGPGAGEPVSAFAGRILWKHYRKILSHGRAIDPGSPDELLHDLRKRGKRFRYLMEFFQGLYPKPAMKAAIADLKRLQDQLGLFQDQCVQIDTLTVLRAEPAAAGAIAAIDRLLDALADQRCQTRAGFGRYFRGFDSKATRARFRALFKPD